MISIKIFVFEVEGEGDGETKSWKEEGREKRKIERGERMDNGMTSLQVAKESY